MLRAKKRTSSKKSKNLDSEKPSQRTLNESQETPWHPCDDGLVPIIRGLNELLEEPMDTLHENIHFLSTRPSRSVARVFNESGLDSLGSRRDMVRRWLQSNNHAADAQEFDDRLQAILDALRQWEESASGAVTDRLNYCKTRADRGLLVEPIHRFGDDVASLWWDVADRVGWTIQYLTQLSMTLRTQLSDKQAPAVLDLKDGTVEYCFVQALFEKEIFDASSLMTTETLVKQAIGPQADPNTYKQQVSNLRSKGIIDTRSGRRGGCWLTEEGRRVASNLLRNNQ